MKAPINKILPYSVVDGIGNRAVVFVQGCNIKCLYCHNPETQNLCIHCGECIKKCPGNALSFDNEGRVLWDIKKCLNCDTCIKTCKYHSSPKVTYLTPEEVMNEVMKSYGFIRGITVSGGECSLYPDFLEALFRLAKKENLSTLMDSNGMVDLSLYPQLMEVCDGVMLDVKALDDKTSIALCQKANSIVYKNLKYLHDINKLTEVRIVVLDDLLDPEAIIKKIYQTLNGDVDKLLLKLIKFRPFGVVGELANKPSPKALYMQKIKAYAMSLGYQKVEVI